MYIVCSMQIGEKMGYYKERELRRLTRLLRYGVLTVQSAEWLHNRGYDLIIDNGEITAIVKRED